jgi:hypothetical protein
MSQRRNQPTQRPSAQHPQDHRQRVGSEASDSRQPASSAVCPIVFCRSGRRRQASSPVTSLPRRRRGLELALRRRSDLLGPS